MKKLLFTLFAIASMSVCAQSGDTVWVKPHLPVVVYDTIVGRSPDYYYEQWYDTCDFFFWDDSIGGSRTFVEPYTLWYRKYMVKQVWTDDTLLVKGLSCMVASHWTHHGNPVNWYCTTTAKLPEYLYYGQFDEKKMRFVTIDSVRWDTAQPKLMMLPKNVDTAWGYEECLVYEVMLDHPISVTGTISLAGSLYSNLNDLTYFHYLPTFYAGIDYDHVRNPYRCVTSAPYFGRDSVPITGEFYSSFSFKTNPFHMITMPGWRVNAHPADTAMGEVLGGGKGADSAYITLTAQPKHGYLFSHWENGDTANPRIVQITSDTSFTAYFRSNEVHQVAVLSSHAAGLVSGGGYYYDQDTAVLSATAPILMRFLQWDDGDTTNPRTIVVTSDTTLKAYFKAPEYELGIEEYNPIHFGLQPNPAQGRVEVVLPDGVEKATITLMDASGKQVMKQTMRRNAPELNLKRLPKGVYFVTLTAKGGTSTQKLVVE